MHKTNTKQQVVRQLTRSDLADTFKSSATRYEFSALLALLFLQGFLRVRKALTLAKRTMTVMIIGTMVLAAGSVPTLAVQQTDGDQAVQPAQQTPAELQQLVAPFALYPDALVAQILAASTYPTQIVEAAMAAEAFKTARRRAGQGNGQGVVGSECEGFDAVSISACENE